MPETTTTKTHGRGRTRPRPPRPADAPAPHPDRLPSPAALRLLPDANQLLLADATAASASTSTALATASDDRNAELLLPPRYPASLDPAPLRTVDLADTHNAAQAHADLHRRLRRHAPARVRGAPFHAGARWTQASLEAALTAPKNAQVLSADAAKARFLHLAPAKNVYGTMYHVREPETVALNMAYPDFRQVGDPEGSAARPPLRSAGAPLRGGFLTSASGGPNPPTPPKP